MDNKTINIKIHEKIFGNHLWKEDTAGYPPRCVVCNKRQIQHEPIPNYCESLTDAMSILLHLEKPENGGWCWMVNNTDEFFETTGMKYAEIWQGNYSKGVSVDASLAKAICLAALGTLEVEV